MRWNLIEKFDVLKKGRFALARKSFQGGEDFFTEHFPDRPVVPGPFFIEMITQAGGVLFGLEIDFKKEVILAKIENARFFRPVVPPCEFVVEANIEEVREDGAWVSGSVKHGPDKVAEAKVLLVAVDSLVGGQAGKIVFNKKFLDKYHIHDVVKTSKAFV